MYLYLQGNCDYIPDFNNVATFCPFQKVCVIYTVPIMTQKSNSLLLGRYLKLIKPIQVVFRVRIV